MSDPTPPDDFTPEEHDELLAAEYVLGTLPGEERRALRDRIEVDGAFAAKVRAWENRFAPLNAAYDEAPAPDILPRIEEQLFGTAQSASAAPQPGWLARYAALLSGLAAAAIFLAVVFFAPAPAPVVLQADLVAEDATLEFAARWDSSEGRLELTRILGEPAPEGQDYELWVIDEDGVPSSLGLLRDPVTQVTATLEAGLTLAISLEPEGGSVEPAPTGPVLAAAPMAQD